VPYDAREQVDRPMAGHRMLNALTLVFGSVAPVTLGTVLIWTAMGRTIDAYGVGLVFTAGLMAIATPYAVGWLRSALALLASTTVLYGLPEWLGDAWIGWVVIVSITCVAAITSLAWFSLRFGTVRRPRDAKSWRTPRATTWPYPYS
jgi:hypothetical protein